MAQQKVELSAGADLRVDLVLAAGDGEDVRHLVTNRVQKRVIGRRVAGVERDGHVDLALEEAVGRDVVDIELQPVVAVAPRDLVAVRDDVK